MTTIQPFLLDENVDIRVGVFLEQEGCTVSFVPKGIRNGEVLALAEKKHCILVTHDGFQVHEFNSNDIGLEKK